MPRSCKSFSAEWDQTSEELPVVHPCERQMGTEYPEPNPEVPTYGRHSGDQQTLEGARTAWGRIFGWYGVGGVHATSLRVLLHQVVGSHCLGLRHMSSASSGF